ncbi:fatty acyl-CoA reductase 1-like [Neodiprion virginianus]|uniref:fatty acyl-CoA reductase 1-like n=1 Tax=Neodiprion virginianus TaxID=2961670 RepID=UPI001EE738A0|nr:fatty acyl-CoA reductase 1-like [Neodiprion virginianus]XP_046616990.1 fatty acyl-CoA reductase 1-like [Neodiprion virginianus]
MEPSSEIAEWYRGRSIFITGATGFVGKVLVEKLLRSCPDIGTIFLLIRDKKDTSSRDRVEQLLSTRLFDEIRTAQASPRDRLVAIPGDVGVPGLGITDEDRRLLQETVSVVFHVAATVRFTEPLRKAVAINIEGTKAVLQLSQGMKNLHAIVHVSTAYANCGNPVIHERIYPPPMDLYKVRHCVAGLDDELLDLITPRLIGKLPNTYTFTKAIAEHLVAEHSTRLPIVVVRPSIVLASWKEPVPGWTDSYNGPNFAVIGTGKGLVNSIYGKKELVADLIPVDVCVNLLVAAAWEIGSRENTRLVPDLRVYNCVSRPFSPITWAFFTEEVNDCETKYAPSDVFMIPSLTMTDCRITQIVSDVLRQIPASLADYLTWMSGGKPRLRAYQKKIHDVSESLEFFTTHEWEFESTNIKLLRDRMSHVDRETFNIDMSKIEWRKYIYNYFMGIRRYIWCEKDSTLEHGRKMIARKVLIAKISLSSILVGILFGVIRFYEF